MPSTQWNFWRPMTLVGVLLMSGFLQEAHGFSAGFSHREKETLVEQAKKEAEDAQERVVQAHVEEQKSIDEMNLQITYKNDKIDQKNKKIKLKTAKIQTFENKIFSSAERQSQLFIQKAKSVREAGHSLSRATWLYLDKQKKLKEKYQQHAGSFVAHQGREAEVSRSIQQTLKALPGARTYIDLIRPMMALSETAKTEQAAGLTLKSESQSLSGQMRNAHQPYLQAIHQVSTIQEEFNLPIVGLPDQTLEQLQNIEAYGQTRLQSTSEQVTGALPEIASQIDRMIRDTAFNKTMKILKDYELWRGGMSFLEIVNGLHKRKVEISAQAKAHAWVGGREPLEPYFHFYHEVLTYKNICSDDPSIQAGSPFKSGCILLKSLLRDAEAFFNRTAKSRMSLALFHAQKIGLPEIAIFVQQLDDALNRYHHSEVQQMEELLLIGVLIHDHLLAKWSEMDGV